MRFVRAHTAAASAEIPPAPAPTNPRSWAARALLVVYVRDDRLGIGKLLFGGELLEQRDGVEAGVLLIRRVNVVQDCEHQQGRVRDRRRGHDALVDEQIYDIWRMDRQVPDSLTTSSEWTVLGNPMGDCSVGA